MIDVKLKSAMNIPPEKLISYAAKMCYTPDVPKMGDLIDIEGRLFRPGHHTTYQHSYLAFCIQAPVSAVCLGLHLASPFYNSDQRSGRFSKMYNNPDFRGIQRHLEQFYPGENTDKALAFIRRGVQIYAGNIGRLTELARQAISRERPFAGEKYTEQNAPKFAQEQLRVFISQITPTALIHTVNLSALASLYRAAWSPELKEITNQMVGAVLKKYPYLAFMFEADKKADIRWTPVPETWEPRVSFRAALRLKRATIDPERLALKKGRDTVDILPFSPEAMDNALSSVDTSVETSCGTFGEDQRHRTILRGSPRFSGAFYVPPLLKKAGLAAAALDYMHAFAGLAQELSPQLMTAIAPYGAMVSYDKHSHINALLHEQGKRTCWCAQEEIYTLSTKLRNALEKRNKDGKLTPLLQALAPPCLRDGKCPEGPRYCGRAIAKTPQDILTYFRQREI